MKYIALVTGANRGIGLETVRQLAEAGHIVLLGSRSKESGETALENLGNPENVELVQLDITRPEDIAAVKAHIQEKYGRIDILVNNAGIFVESADPTDMQAASALTVNVETIEQTLNTNTFGPYRMFQAFLPMMIEQNYGRVVNISSGMGTLHDMGGGWPGYRMSKTAINVLTRVFAYEVNNYNIKINSVCPGWVRTDMGSPDAPKSPEDAAKGIVWAATLPDDGPSAAFFRDSKEIGW